VEVLDFVAGISNPYQRLLCHSLVRLVFLFNKQSPRSGQVIPPVGCHAGVGVSIKVSQITQIFTDALHKICAHQ